jgi:hypothetical protein
MDWRSPDIHRDRPDDSLASEKAVAGKADMSVKVERDRWKTAPADRGRSRRIRRDV